VRKPGTTNNRTPAEYSVRQRLTRLARQDDRMRTEPYPSWDYFPRNARPPEWVEPLITNVRAAQQSISTVERKTGLDSDHVLQQLAAGLRELGFAVESGKKATERIRRPVLFGSNGHAAVSYEIDAFHDAHGIVVEVEAGRGHAATAPTATSSAPA
jgi:hypothetical protein